VCAKWDRVRLVGIQGREITAEPYLKTLLIRLEDINLIGK